MDNSIYEVSRDEYVGFVDQIKPECIHAENFMEENGFKVLKIYSDNTGTHLCSRFLNEDTGEEYYYVFNMPEDSERRAAPAKRKITLETKEEVQAFFDVLNKIKEGKVND